MADSDTLKEYLIALGFKVDEQGLKKFDGAVSKTEQNVQKFAGTVLAAAVTVEAGITRIADKYTDLFYASERLSASVENIDAFIFASKQIGVSADASAGAVASFVNAMRLNPGIAGFASKLIGKDATALDSVEAYLAVVEKLKKSFGANGPGFAIGARYGSMMGIDPATLRQDMLHLDELKAKYQEQKQAQKDAGLDQTKAAAVAREYHNALATLEKRVGTLADKFATQWEPALTRIIEDLEHGVDWLVKVDKATDGWSTTIGIVVGSMGAWATAAFALRSALGLLGVTATETAAATTAATVAGAEAAAASAARLGAGTVAGLAVAGGTLGIAAENIATNDTSNPIGAAANKFARYNIWKNDIIPFAHRAANFALRRQTYKQSGSDIEKLMSLGWTKAQATGMIANVIRESSGNEKLTGDGGKAYGLGQWHPDRQAEFRKKFGKDIREASHDEQLEFMSFELSDGKEKPAGDRLRRTTDPEDAARVVSLYSERPANADIESYNRAGIARDLANQTDPNVLNSAIAGINGKASSFDDALKRAQGADARLGNVAPLGADKAVAPTSISVTNKTDIKVTGTADPNRTATAVASEQGRVNADHVRGLSTLVN